MLKELKIYLKYYHAKYFKKQSISNLSSNRVFLLLTPTHGNLGDQAIRYSENLFLQDSFPGKQILDITLTDFPKYLLFLKNNVKQDDILFIHGGGNLGDLYIVEEFYRRSIIKHFPNNRIISFPQSIAMKNINKLDILKKSKKTYEKHTNLIFLMRESHSLDLFEKYILKENTFFYPDIVLYNKVNYGKEKKDRILFLFRDDSEALYNKEFKEKLIDWVIQSGYSILKSDTHINKNISNQANNIYSELDLKMEEIRKSNLVITDRLHGMILAYICGVSCIVFDNTTKKISFTYNDWLKKSNTIELLDSKISKQRFLDIVNNLYGQTSEDLNLNLKFEQLEGLFNE